MHAGTGAEGASVGAASPTWGQQDGSASPAYSDEIILGGTSPFHTSFPAMFWPQETFGSDSCKVLKAHWRGGVAVGEVKPNLA